MSIAPHSCMSPLSTRLSTCWACSALLEGGWTWRTHKSNVLGRPFQTRSVMGRCLDTISRISGTHQNCIEFKMQVSWVVPRIDSKLNNLNAEPLKHKKSIASHKSCFSAGDKPPARAQHTEIQFGDAPRPNFSIKGKHTLYTWRWRGQSACQESQKLCIIYLPI